MPATTSIFERYTGLWIALAALLMFVPFAGGVHLFDWDEINFAECAREMIVTGDYLNVQINYSPFWEKPPLFIWMQVLSMKTFGVNEFAARFPNALAGLISLLLVYKIGLNNFSKRIGILWVLMFAGSILPHFYFRSGIIDPWFNLFIFTALWFFFEMHQFGKTPGKRLVRAAMWGVFTGLAILTKGPVALLIIGFVVGMLYLPFMMRKVVPGNSYLLRLPDYQLRASDIFVFITATILIGGSWFAMQLANGHGDMVVRFITYQIRLFTIPDAGHGGHWSYHFWVLLAGVFPASLFAIRGFGKVSGLNPNQKQFRWLMLVIFWVVLILFSVVKTKIVHYSSLCYFPLTFLAALAADHLIAGKSKWNKFQTALLAAISLILMLLTGVIPFLGKFRDQIIQSGVIKDDFAVANLQADVSWTGFEWILPLILFAGVIAFFIFLRKKKVQLAITGLFSASILFVVLVILLFPYRIEKYSQGAVIEFYKQKSNEKCYVLNSGYFSYAPLFYSNRQPDDIRRPLWLLTGDIDRPFYLVLKQPHYNKWKHIVPAMSELYHKNGFVFLARYPKGYLKEKH